MPKHDNQGWSWCRKAFFQYILVVNTTLLSHYDRGYKPLKAVNTCPYTARVRLHLVWAPHFYFERCTTERRFSVSDLELTSITSSSSSSSSVICQTTGPKNLPKRFLHIVRSRASSFNWQYALLFLRSSSSFLRLPPRLLVTSISPFTFPSITCCRRQFLRKMWPIQLAFAFLFHVGYSSAHWL